MFTLTSWGNSPHSFHFYCCCPGKSFFPAPQEDAKLSQLGRLICTGLQAKNRRPGRIFLLQEKGKTKVTLQRRHPFPRTPTWKTQLGRAQLSLHSDAPMAPGATQGAAGFALAAQSSDGSMCNEGYDIRWQRICIPALTLLLTGCVVFGKHLPRKTSVG